MATLITSGNSDGTRRCDARCYDAKASTCDCLCGGRNHGVGFQLALEQTRRAWEQWSEDWRAKHPGDVVLEHVTEPLFRLFDPQELQP
jgi:hypothetical protein